VVSDPPLRPQLPTRCADHGLDRMIYMSWDPAQYELFAAERARPFHDLVAQIPTGTPEHVVDLGCGPGAVTATLADRWPEAHVYLATLAGAGLTVNAWETTYLHVLPGDDPVLEWFAGTGLRPYLDALATDPDALARFRAEVAERLRIEYPRREYGTVLPFRRL